MVYRWQNNYHVVRVVLISLKHAKKYRVTRQRVYARCRKKFHRSHLEYIVVEKYHDDAGYVEAGQARVDDKIRIVEQTLVRYPIGGVIQA